MMPNAVCLLSRHSRGCRMATSCPADSATTGFFLDGAAAACSQLLSYCSGANGLSAHGCTIAGLCPVTCGACASQQFCDVVDTQIQLGGATATCAQLASLCNDATQGPRRPLPAATALHASIGLGVLRKERLRLPPLAKSSISG